MNKENCGLKLVDEIILYFFKYNVYKERKKQTNNYIQSMQQESYQLMYYTDKENGANYHIPTTLKLTGDPLGA